VRRAFICAAGHVMVGPLSAFDELNQTTHAVRKPVSGVASMKRLN
jgi:hypothetical protein